MDWIRRNWPDLLIGVALVAVIALIVATLLSGGSMMSLFRRSTAPELPNTTTTTPAGEQPEGSAGTPLGSSETPTAGSSTPETAGTPDGGNVDVFVPGLPGTSGAATDAAPVETDSSEGEASGTAAQPEPQAVSVNAPLPEAIPNGGFRVAAGAVNSRDGALSAAQTLRDADYTVTVEQQDDLYLLWVGPYASRAGAERVAERLSDDELVPDALVYSYDPEEEAAEADTSASGTDDASTPSAQPAQVANGGTSAATTTPATPDATVTPPTANTAPDASGEGQTAATGELSAPDGQSFLQVGAFGSAESAQPQREQLEGLGLSVTSSQDDNGVIRLYVGPFAGQRLAQTQAQLDTQGIDSFPVTP